MENNRFRRLVCLGCGFLYDEAAGLPEHGLAAGTRWDDIPEDWVCPDCGTPKAMFEMVELPYAEPLQGRQTQRPPRPAQPAAPSRAPARPPENFVLRDSERGFRQYLSTGHGASYIAGHPNAILSRHSSFNFHEYQSGRQGFGPIRVFGEEVFSGAGCGYNMHPHHDFVICAFVLDGELTHVNTVGNVDQLHADDYYVFSAGSGGKHSELNLRDEDMRAIYMWFLPSQLLLPPSYHRARYDGVAGRNRLVTLVGDEPGALPIPQDVRISRLRTDGPVLQRYKPGSPSHGVYLFVVSGAAECADVQLSSRDSMALFGDEPFALRTGPGVTDILFVEAPYLEAA